MTTNLYVINKRAPANLPQASHPVKARYMKDNCIWVWNEFHPHAFSSSDKKIVLEVKHDETPGKLLHIVSDALVHIEAEQVTGAWHIFKTQDTE